LGKRQIAEFIENDEVDTGEPVGYAAVATELGFARGRKPPRRSKAAAA
jgi:hypothetical protein